jgi:hypothetical protein
MLESHGDSRYPAARSFAHAAGFLLDWHHDGGTGTRHDFAHAAFFS